MQYSSNSRGCELRFTTISTVKALILILALLLPAAGGIETNAKQNGNAAKSDVAKPTREDAATPRGEVPAMVRAVTEDELRVTVRELVAFKSRTVGQPGNKQAAAYLHERFKQIPGLRVAALAEPWNNVIATLPGTDPASRELFIVGAHYDSRGERPELAPGAMDDAAGIAIVLEMARVLSQHRFTHSIAFACWNGEEIGLKGSRAFVQQLVKDGRKVSLYLNYDSTAYDPKNRLVLDVIARPPAAAAKKLLFENNQRYAIGFSLVENRHACGGDHISFAEAGFPAINTHQEIHGAHYHTANDTIERVSFSYAAKNCRLGLSIIATLANASSVTR